jgi:hypothetical protein
LSWGEPADRLGQRAQLVAGKIEILELGELANRLWQRAQFHVGQIQPLRTAFPGFLDAAQGFFGRRVVRGLFGKPFRHTRRKVEITDAQLLCRFSNVFLGVARCRYA